MTKHLKPPAINGQYLLFVDFEKTRNTDDGYDHDAAPLRERIVPPGDFHSATSAIATDPGELCPDLRSKKHRVVLDLDMPAAVISSSTPGHGHLYIDHELSWDEYVRLMDVMAEVGLLERGYVAASKRRGFTTVRLPWVRKGETTVTVED